MPSFLQSFLSLPHFWEQWEVGASKKLRFVACQLRIPTLQWPLPVVVPCFRSSLEEKMSCPRSPQKQRLDRANAGCQVPSSTGSLQSSNSSKTWRIDGGILIQELPLVQCNTAADGDRSRTHAMIFSVYIFIYVLYIYIQYTQYYTIIYIHRERDSIVNC